MIHSKALKILAKCFGENYDRIAVYQGAERDIEIQAAIDLRNLQVRLLARHNKAQVSHAVNLDEILNVRVLEKICDRLYAKLDAIISDNADNSPKIEFNSPPVPTLDTDTNTTHPAYGLF